MKKQDMIKEIIDYCEPHLDMTWAARMIGIALECDFRDCQKAVDEYRERNVDQEISSLAKTICSSLSGW